MTIDAANFDLPRFGIGTVLSTSLFALKRNLLRFLGLGAIFAIPLSIVTAIAVVASASSIQKIDSIKDIPSGFVLAFLLFMFAFMVIYFLYNGAIAYGSLQYLRGRKAGIGECIGRAFRALPQMIGVGLFFGLVSLFVVFVIAIIGAFLMLLTQAFTGAPSMVGVWLLLPIVCPMILFISVCWWIVIPVAVVERPGVWKSFSRSFILTEGYRWKILGILLIMWLVSLVAGIIPLLFALYFPELSAGLSSLINILLTIWMTVLPAIGYGLLSNEKDGTAVRTVAKVFE